MADGIRSTYAIAMAIFVILGLVLVQIPKMQQQAYAHTFSGNESSAFIATVGVLRTELRLINDTIATNSSQANEHAKIAVEHLSANDTSELRERNQRIGADLPKDLSSLQNSTANLSPTNTTGIAAIKQKISDTDALLSEALQVRVEPTQLTNSTVYGTAVADLLNETLERYGEAVGIGANTSTSSSGLASTTAANNMTGGSAAVTNRSNNTAMIVNSADYQSTIGLVNTTMELLNHTRSLLNTTSTTGSSAMVKVDNDLNQLTTLIENKSSYSPVATFVYSTLYPDLNSALNLGLHKVDVNKAVQDAMSGRE